MSSFQIPDEVWAEDYDSDLPLDLRYWRSSPPATLIDEGGGVMVEHSFEEGGVTITVAQLVTALRAQQDSARAVRHTLTNTAIEQGEFALHRPPDEDVDDHAPVTEHEYNFVRGYILTGAAHFWASHLPDWRRLQETQSLIYYFGCIERGSDAFWEFTFRYIPGQDPGVEAFLQLPA